MSTYSERLVRTIRRWNASNSISEAVAETVERTSGKVLYVKNNEVALSSERPKRLNGSLTKAGWTRIEKGIYESERVPGLFAYIREGKTRNSKIVSFLKDGEPVKIYLNH